jgi:hypothetical protein
MPTNDTLAILVAVLMSTALCTVLGFVVEANSQH